jgi:hypothetical protein
MIERNFKLIKIVANKSVDESFFLGLLIEGKPDVESLMFSIGNNASFRGF